MEPARKQEIVNVCLEAFMKKGLVYTSTRDLSAALGMNNAAVFYYFKTKDDIVIACAEEASLRIERDLIGVALKDIENPKRMMEELRDRADAMRSLMQFFISVCTHEKYAEALQPTFNKLNQRYDQYVERFAQVLKCEPKEVSPYVYIGINTMLSYMLFGMNNFVAPQLNVVFTALIGFLEKRDQNMRQ